MSGEYQTTPVRIVLGFFIGSAVGAVLTTIALWAPKAVVVYFSGDTFDRVQLSAMLRELPLIGSLTYVFFAGLLLLIGAPLWALLHQLKLRSPAAATALGATASFLASLALFIVPVWLRPTNSSYSSSEAGQAIIDNNQITAHGWSVFIGQSALVGIAGALTGLVIWAVAYRRIPPTTGSETQ